MFRSLVVSVCLCGVGSLVSSAAHSQVSNTRTITVLATGSAQASAKESSLELSVSSMDQTATALFVRQHDVVQRLRSALEKAGVASGDIQEKPARVVPNYEYGQQGTRIIGYRIETPLTVRVADLALLPHLIDIAAQGGANMINVGAYTSNTSLHEQAVKNALAAARKEGEMLAGEIGASLGSVVSIQEMEDEPKAAATKGGEEEEEERQGKAKSATDQGAVSEKAELQVVYELR